MAWSARIAVRLLWRPWTWPWVTRIVWLMFLNALCVCVSSLVYVRRAPMASVGDEDEAGEVIDEDEARTLAEMEVEDEDAVGASVEGGSSWASVDETK